MSRTRNAGGSDFVVLNANPLHDIPNTRNLYNVYLRGQEATARQ